MRLNMRVLFPENEQPKNLINFSIDKAKKMKSAFFSERRKHVFSPYFN